MSDKRLTGQVDQPNWYARVNMTNGLVNMHLQAFCAADAKAVMPCAKHERLFLMIGGQELWEPSE